MRRPISGVRKSVIRPRATSDTASARDDGRGERCCEAVLHRRTRRSDALCAWRHRRHVPIGNLRSRGASSMTARTAPRWYGVGEGAKATLFGPEVGRLHWSTTMARCGWPAAAQRAGNGGHPEQDRNNLIYVPPGRRSPSRRHRSRFRTRSTVFICSSSWNGQRGWCQLIRGVLNASHRNAGFHVIVLAALSQSSVGRTFSRSSWWRYGRSRCWWA